MPTIIRGTTNQPVSTGISAVNRFTPTAQTCCCPVCSGLQCLDRTRFFAGQLLSEADLNNEQSYWLAKSRLHNRYLVGWGVACGLQVVCGQCDGWVTVQSGYAIDPCGNDIIVCQDQNFNVAKAIRECCTPAKTTPDCSPLRYNPPQGCSGPSTWCITIQYQEQPSRLVTPLTTATSQSSGSQACGCGCSNGNGSKSSSSSSSWTTTGSCMTSATSTPAAVTVPAGTCEATRIVEGFQLGVIPGDEYQSLSATQSQGGLAAALEQCIAGLLQLVQKQPDLNQSMQPQAAYVVTCNYLAAVRNYFAASTTVTHCKVLDALGRITVSTNGDIAEYTGILAEIRKILALAFLDCICYSLLPTCPPNPCDSRIILACVTIDNGIITDICHFTGRKQLVTLQTLGYWLGGLGFDKIVAELDRLLALYCCMGDSRLDNIGFRSATGIYDNQMVTSAGLATGADLHRVAAHYVAQSLGAGAVNAIAPDARAVDLRPLVNTTTDNVRAKLEEQGFKSVQVVPVDEDPYWTSLDPSTVADFVPSAVSAGQPLKVYTQGQSVVGFAVVDRVSAQLQDLQDQINALKNQLSAARANNPAAAQPRPPAGPDKPK